MRGNTLVVSESRSLVIASDQDGRTTMTPHNLCGQVLVLPHVNYAE